VLAPHTDFVGVDGIHRTFDKKKIELATKEFLEILKAAPEYGLKVPAIGEDIFSDPVSYESVVPEAFEDGKFIKPLASVREEFRDEPNPEIAKSILESHPVDAGYPKIFREGIEQNPIKDADIRVQFAYGNAPWDKNALFFRFCLKQGSQALSMHEMVLGLAKIMLALGRIEKREQVPPPCPVMWQKCLIQLTP
jgi:hypothetical protein